MSTIPVNNNERVLKIEAFLGLNENPDGDTKLRLGEASVCRNWRVTRDRNLQRRPGSKTLFDLGINKPVSGMWFGHVSGHDICLVASGGHLWKIKEDGEYLEEAEDLGELNTDSRVNFFAYSNIVYILNGEEYYQYDDVAFKPVPGYRPLIATSREPSGANSTLLEEVNKLTGMRRVWFSPDGKTKEYILPEKDLMSVDYVKVNATEAYVLPENYTKDRLNGKVTFDFGTKDFSFTGDGSKKLFALPSDDPTLYSVVITSVKVNDTPTEDYQFDDTAQTIEFTDAPAAESEIEIETDVVLCRGVNTIEIGYTAVNTYRNDVAKMTNAEIFLGAQDNAVFLYGNNTNEAVYSALDYWGQPRADYFPDLNEVAVADENTPITAMIRHYSQLLCFKNSSAYVIHFGMITTATGDNEYGFYVTPVNKSIGNAALGQVRLVLNSPFVLFGNDLYEWKNSGSYSSNLTLDERQAKRISDRIYSTLGTFSAKDCYCYDDNDGQEYYICYGDKALVYNYAADAWYVYTGLDICSMCNTEDELLFGTSDGRIKILSDLYLNDDGVAIDSYWQSGSMDMGKNYMRKLMSELWVSMKPEEASQVTVTVQTDKKSEYTEKTIDSSLATFAHVDYADFTFNVNRRPQVKKLKIKAKKFAFLKLIFRTNDLHTTATILSADPKIRETGYAK